MVNIDVCICTFRRPSLFETLKTVAEQVLPPDVNITVIVANNDDENLIEDKIHEAGKALGLTIRYVFAPKFNISIARNACLDAATGDLIAFIDDDELARPHWLAQLLSCRERTGASVLFAPVHAIYPEDTPNWIVANDFHSNLPTSRNGVVETGFTSNVLLDRSDEMLCALRFDQAFGRTGGEDVDFFFRAHRIGVKLGICQEAVIDEPVAPARASLKWLIHRMYAFGQFYGHFSLENQPVKRAGLAMKAATKGAYCMARCALSAFSTERASFWFLRGTMHLGVIFGSFSAPKREAYGDERP